MIRLTTQDDTDSLIALAETLGLFSSEDLALLRQMLVEALAESDDTKPFWLTDDDNGPVGVAYIEPERMTSGTWNLQLLAIHPDRQRQGRGAMLLHAVEQALRARQGRMLLVETSGLPDFESTRQFYRKCGYEQEACIRDFYSAGDDKIVFRKLLSPC